MQQFIARSPGAMPQDTRGIPWTGDNVFSSGNLTLDLLHNFFLEIGARQHKLRVYEMSTDPVVRLPADSRRRASTGLRQGAGKADRFKRRENAATA